MSEMRTCERTGCGNVFKRQGKRIYCTMGCSRLAQQEQLRNYNANRVKAAPLEQRRCGWCNNLYTPKHSKQKWCKMECRIMAIAAMKMPDDSPP